MTQTRDQVQALTDLLEQVIHSLSMTQYQIDNATEACNVETAADDYYQQMLDILHS